MKFDPADMVLFACVAEEGSFSGAAERLDIPNSTVSRRIATLENQLGERLIVRTTRKMVITEYGKAVLRHAQQISAEMEAMLALTENRQAKPSGLLRISMPGDFSQNMIGALLADFIEKYPQVTLDIDSSQQRVDIISEGYDIALRMGNLQNDSTLVARQLSTFRVGLYAAPSFIKKQGVIRHPQDLMERAVLRLRTRAGEISPWTLTHGDEYWEGSPPMRAVANSPSVLINLARLGAGVTSVTTHFAHPYLATGELVRVLEDWECPGVPVWAVFPGRRLMPSRTRVFIDSLVASFEKFTSKY